jgi:hypothetical protein
MHKTGKKGFDICDYNSISGRWLKSDKATEATDNKPFEGSPEYYIVDILIFS